MTKTSRLAKLHAATDRQMGETVRIVPQRGGGYVAGGVDQNRQPVELLAYVARSPGIERSQSSGANTGHNAELRLSPDTVKFTTTAVPYTVEAGDLIEFPETESPTCRVSRSSAYGTDRTILFLVKVSR